RDHTIGAALAPIEDGNAGENPSAGAGRGMNRQLVRAPQSIRHHTLALAGAVAFLVGSIGIMGAATDMSGAVIASGSLVVESNVKKVQHPSGGVAKQLFVEDGSHVAKNDLLVRMDETVAQANLSAVTKTLWELEARRARLQAERDGEQEIAFPESIAS